jgi:TolB-like protein/cytochrome c-type biogenesis protein CcmH/NrfG
MAGSTVRFGPFLFDRDGLTVTQNGITQHLGTRGAALLRALLEAQGQVVQRQTLLDTAWPDATVEEGNLTVQIAALRRALGTRTDAGEWIETVPRVGYRFVPPVDEPAERARGPAIAVLPFANFGSDSEQDYLADGIVEDLITALSRFHTFAVVSRNSSFVYKGRQVDARVIARELGVRYLLEGSVRRLGDRIRVTTQLIEGSSGAHIWAEKFDRLPDRILDVLDEIIDTVAGLIEPQIRKAEIVRARRKRPEHLDAWDLYVQAVPLVYGSSVPAYGQAINLLERAIAIDPDYAPALTLAAWAHEKRITFGGPAAAEPNDAERAFELAQRAVAADPDDALALSQLGWQCILFRSDFSGLDLCARAVGLNPNNVPALHFAGTANLFAGDLDEVIRCYTRALNLSPGSPDTFMSLSGIASGHFSAGRYAEAIIWARKTIEAAPDYMFGHIFLAASCAQLGRISEARAAIEAALKIRPDLTVAGKTSVSMRFPERRLRMVEGLRKAGLPES